MKKKLLLFMAKSEFSLNVVVAPTLAWLSTTKNYIFDNYYDSYHQGVHFQGGDSRNLEEGQLTGGTVCGDRHFEEFYFLLLNFDVSIYSFDNTMFLSTLRNIENQVVILPEKINEIYQNIFKSFELPIPKSIVMFNSNIGKSLKGINTYLYPEIYFRQAIGVLDNITEIELNDLYQENSTIYCVYVDNNTVKSLQKKGYRIKIVDKFDHDDDYFSITKKIALRWKDKVKGWILGDPTLIPHWLPKACEENLISIYSVPQEKIVTELGDILKTKGKVIYGRQYSDKDFFEISKLDKCLQVIDPCRPPFQSIRHAGYEWHAKHIEEGFYESEYSDDDLKKFAKEGKILISLMFWSGMIREVANLYNLMDLFAITRLRSGLILTSQSFEYMMHSPIEMLTIPVEQGGVYPLIEPILGSCGTGVGIESYIDNEIVKETLNDALDKIFKKVKKQNLMPRGWWPTMDVKLEKLPYHKRPKPIKLIKYAPYLQLRYRYKEKKYNDRKDDDNFRVENFSVNNLMEKIKAKIIKAGLLKYFEPYRPYEFYRAGSVSDAIIDVAKSTGMKYMFTKAGFNEDPRALYIDNNFVALNYTSGQWDGWTPFETVNDVSDLKKSEKRYIKKGMPGWIVSTIDSCLWVFSGEFWKKGSKLYEIAKFCAEGGSSGLLINTKPYTVARYARIISEKSVSK